MSLLILHLVSVKLFLSTLPSTKLPLSLMQTLDIVCLSNKSYGDIDDNNSVNDNDLLLKESRFRVKDSFNNCVSYHVMLYKTG